MAGDERTARPLEQDGVSRFDVLSVQRDRWKDWFWKGFVAFWVLYILAPPVLLVLISFDGASFIRIPQSFSLMKYEAMFASGELLGAIRRTIVLAVITSIVTPILALCAVLTYRRSERKRLIIAALVLPLFLPGIVQGVSLMIIFQQINFDYAFAREAIGHIIWALPFAFLVLLTTMSSISEDNLLASSDLGANEFETFRYVVYPQLKPGLISAVIFSFVLSFNEFARTFYLQGRLTTIPTYVWAQIQVTESPELFALSGATVMFSLLLIGIGSFYLYHAQ
ncbi:ABC transporter permease [Natrarchaeobius sp. A-rgal3]|uniref:ABC transporter permease n=1 Tax=Natrarchaeobius versutus TaxID=1679078 RepID=UPI00350F4737